MNDNTIVAQVETALSEVLEREVTGLTEDIRLFEDLHLDSTSVMEMLMELEDSMKIVIDPENLDMDDFQTIATLTGYLRRISPEQQDAGE
ncbi:acyl carrier protein [Streptomyces griseus]|uniref:Phosphopantetheine-binding protein n=1 Tax=Streptomyces sp. CMC78 TaxID=3231512 RepID=A0AB33KSN0_9ACTN|nr:phosphopantetheine-binding protein [Streptomyces sp. ID01-9D]MDX5571295.1 phosphopantetheine-binding protein [Streptomyces sp. ID01-9D]WSV21620.1 phosphopantetheine-binding protein [Streptomyces fimicarius]WTC89494.1 phosphopantetheine-binding protein [Streptomyces griseus]WTD67878.1 phosphopantetheine-binding protein [Streptomyces griseus]